MTREDRQATLLLFALILCLLGLSCLGLGTYFFREFTAREDLLLVEGRLVEGSVDGSDALSFRVVGYARELILAAPEEALAPVEARLREGPPPLLRLRVEPWWNHAGRASVVELETLGAEPETWVSYAQVLEEHERDNRAGGVLGLSFGLVLLGLAWGWLLPQAQPRLPAAEGRITRDLYVDRPLLLSFLLPCVGMETLSVWGVLNVPRDPTFVVAIPTALLFGGASLALLRPMLRLGPTLSIDDRGLALRGCARIPWDEIQQAVWDGSSLTLSVTDQARRLRREGLRFRALAWLGGKLGLAPYRVGLTCLEGGSAQVGRILESHGLALVGPGAVRSAAACARPLEA